MEADDTLASVSDGKGYQSCSSVCSSSINNAEQIQNSGKKNDKPVGMWSTAFCVSNGGEENKRSYQCPSPCRSSTGSLACSVDDYTTAIEMGDLDELDDLLQRFDTFFREKVDAELQSVREFMHGMLSEQQIHLQQILSSRLQSKSSYCQSSPHHSREDEGIQDHKVPETTEKTTFHSDMSISAAVKSEETYPKSATSEILLELMSLSCELSAVLSQSKYL